MATVVPPPSTRLDRPSAPGRGRARACLSLTAVIVLAVTVPAGAAPVPPPEAGTSRDGAAAWLPPVPGAGPEDLLRAFDPPPAPWSPGHRGIDLEVTDGAVTAPAEGVVRFAGPVAGRSVVTVSHPDGSLSSVEPVVAEVQVGERVRAGDPLGQVEDGVDHCSVPCLHWGVRVPDAWRVGGTVRDRYLDPALLLGWSGPSVLWPLEGTPRNAP